MSLLLGDFEGAEVIQKNGSRIIVFALSSRQRVLFSPG